VRTLAVDAADVATTEFNLSTARQDLLIKNGREAAQTFLEAFRLEDYMNTFHAGLAPTETANLANRPVHARRDDNHKV
jgi:hypothetical protein